MPSRLVSLFAVASLTMAAWVPSWALDLIWSSGNKDMVMTASAPCTLLVLAGTTETLPSEWRLLWVADGGPSPQFLREDRSEGTAVACAIQAPSDLASVLDNVTTIHHCAVGAGREAIGRYILQFSAPVRAKFRLFLPGMGLGFTAEGEVTVNGGTEQHYPPLIETVRIQREGEAVVLLISGVRLDQARSVSFLRATGPAITASFEIVRSEAGLLVARASHVGLLPPGVVTVESWAGARATHAVAEEGANPAPFAPGRLIVRFRDAEVEPLEGRTEGAMDQFVFRSNALRDVLTATGISKLRRLLPWFEHADVHSTNLRGTPVTLADLSNLYVVEFDPNADVTALEQAIHSSPGVLYAHPDVRVEAMFDPNDTLYGQQWGLHYAGDVCGSFPAAPTVNVFAPSAWDLTFGSSSVRIAILDTGIDNFHPELAGRVETGISFVEGVSSSYDDDSSVRHGTAVAGIAGATGNNGEGIAGLDWQASLVPVKVLNQEPEDLGASRRR